MGIVLLVATSPGCGARSDLFATTADEDPSLAPGEGGGGTTRPSRPVCPAASTPTTIAMGSDGHSAVEVDETYVFIGTEDGDILRIPKELGAEASTIAHGDDRVTGIALDATHVTWGTWSGGVYRIPKDGGELLTISRGASWSRVAVDDSRIYWLSGSESPGSDSLLATDKDGANEVVLASGMDQAWWIGADESGVYVSTRGASPGLYRVSAGDDALSLLSEGRVLQAFVVEDDVIWAGSFLEPDNGSSGHIERIDKGSGARETVAYTGSRAWGIAVDESDVYYTPSRLPPDLLKVPKSGGEPQYWAEVPDDWEYVHNLFYGVATDSAAVYWTNSWTADWRQDEGGATFVRCKDP